MGGVTKRLRFCRVAKPQKASTRNMPEAGWGRHTLPYHLAQGLEELRPIVEANAGHGVELAHPAVEQGDGGILCLGGILRFAPLPLVCNTGLIDLRYQGVGGIELIEGDLKGGQPGLDSGIGQGLRVELTDGHEPGDKSAGEVPRYGKQIACLGILTVQNPGLFAVDTVVAVELVAFVNEIGKGSGGLIVLGYVLVESLLSFGQKGFALGNPGGVVAHIGHYGRYIGL